MHDLPNNNVAYQCLDLIQTSDVAIVLRRWYTLIIDRKIFDS